MKEGEQRRAVERKALVEGEGEKRRESVDLFGSWVEGEGDERERMEDKDRWWWWSREVLGAVSVEEQAASGPGESSSSRLR